MERAACGVMFFGARRGILKTTDECPQECHRENQFNRSCKAIGSGVLGAFVGMLAVHWIVSIALARSRFPFREMLLSVDRSPRSFGGPIRY